MRSRLRTLLAVGALGSTGLVGLVGACTDGTTPDCSDAATQCGPNVGDGSFDGSDAVAADANKDSTLPDTSTPDTGLDADLDAGDEV